MTTAKNKNTYSTGKKYENMAAAYLEGCGYRILERNYRGERGELDIVAKNNETLVFLEIKYRGSGICGDPLEAVDTRKQRRISRTALYYLTKQGYGTEVPCRFDVIAVYGDGAIRHVKHAFEFQA